MNVSLRAFWGCRNWKDSAEQIQNNDMDKLPLIHLGVAIHPPLFLRPDLFVWKVRHLNFKRPIWRSILYHHLWGKKATFEGPFRDEVETILNPEFAMPITHRPSQNHDIRIENQHTWKSTCLINIKHLLKCGTVKISCYWFHACLILDNGREIGFIVPHLLHPLMGRIPRDFLWLTRWDCWHSGTSRLQSGCHWRSFRSH